MAEEFKIQKIKVKPEYELTDVVSEINNSKADSIVIIFSEHSDLLVSPINLQVIQDTSDEKNTPIVFQIFDSRAGLRNAASINAVFTDKSEEIPVDLWDHSYKQMKARQQKYQDSLKKGPSVPPSFAKDKEEDIVSDMQDKLVESYQENVETEALEDAPDIKDLEMIETVEEMPVKEKTKSEFSERIDKALEKSKSDISKQKHSTIEAGGLRIAMDHDITDEDLSVKTRTPENEQKIHSLSSRDLFNSPNPENKTQSKEIFVETSGRERFSESFDNNKLSEGSFFAKLLLKIKALFRNKKFKKLLLLIIIPLILIVSIGLLIYYKTAPRVNVEIFIESRPVESEMVFTGSPAVEVIDLENLKIPILKETVKKELSDSTNATGTAVKGTKASGIVRFICGPINGESNVPKTIAAGTTLTTDTGLKYKLSSDVSFTCPSISSPTGTAEALEFGKDYNISAGVLLTVSGDADVVATSETSFTGGSKEEYTVISKADYDKVVNPLKESAFKEAKSELENKASDEWVLIPSSIVEKLDGDIKSDFPIGAEVEILNVTVKTISTALYYKKSDLQKSAKDILLNTAEKQNLFESENSLDLQLGDDYTVNEEIVKVDGDTVTLKTFLAGAVKPLVKKDEIINDLNGLKFTEGLDYLSKLDFVTKDSVVKFLPESFPKGLRYFPDRQGRLQIKITEIEKETEEE